MMKLSKILWTIAILFIVSTVITFAFGLLLVGGMAAGIIGIYRYYRWKKRLKNLQVWSRGFSSGEIIDIQKK